MIQHWNGNYQEIILYDKKDYKRLSLNYVSVCLGFLVL